MKFADMMTSSVETLSQHFYSCQALVYNASKMAQSCNPRSRTGRKLASQMGFLLRQQDMVLSCLRKRGLQMVKVAA